MAKELYVGHLPYDMTAEELRRLFSVSGTVTSVHIITDPVNGKSKGCAYVRMSSPDALRDAIDTLDGAMVEGRLITVSEAKPQKQLAPSPGRGRFGGAPKPQKKGRK